MRYLIAIIVPPLAVLLCGKLFQTLLNAALFCGGVVLLAAGVGLPLVIAAVVHALLVVSSALADKRANKVIQSLNRGR